MKKRIWTALLAAGLALLTACSGTTHTAVDQAQSDAQAPAQEETANEETTEEAAEETEEKELTKVRIGYGNHLGCALYFIAEEEGYFEDYGLDAELILLDDSAKGLAAMRAGQLDCGSYGSTATFSLIAQGEKDLRVFGGQMHEGSGIITLPENAEELSDFNNYKGKKLGLVRMSTGDVVFRAALVNAGLVPGEDVEIVELGSGAEIMEGVKKGELDAGAIWVPQLSNAESQGLEVACLSGEVLPNHP